MTSGLLDPSSTLGRVGKSCPAARLVKLADCVDLLSGFAFKSQEFTNDPHDVALVKGENVSQGRVLWDISKRWPLEDWRKYEKFQLAAGDVVIAMDRPWVPAGLKWCFIRDHDPQALLVQRCCRLRVNPRLMDQTFLRCVIGGPGFESYIKPITTGVNIPHISGRQILDYSFPLPDLPTQRKIAGILSAYDDLIENNLRRIKILEEMAQSLYREWFVHFRFPGHESVSLVDSSLGSIPEGWEVKVLGEIAEFRLGKMLDKEKNKGELMPYLANVNVRWGRFELDELREMRFTPDELDSYGLRGGDIVMCEGGEPGRCAVWNEQTPGMMIQKAIHRIRCRENMNHSFLYQSLLRLGQGGHLASLFTGATIKHLPREQLAKVRIVAPPKSLLDAFIKFVRPAENQVDVLASKIQTLRRTRDLLLPKLLNPI